MVDVENERLLIGEALETGSAMKRYTHDSEFTGRIIDEGLFSTQAEVIVLYAYTRTAGQYHPRLRPSHTRTRGSFGPSCPLLTVRRAS